VSDEYWNESVSEALDEYEIHKDRNVFFEDIRHIAEMESEACGYLGIPNPLVEENEKLQHELNRERKKVHCKACNGKGRIIEHGPVHSYNSECWKCNGEGRHSL